MAGPATALIGEVLAAARRRLTAAAFAPSAREASLLLGHLTGYSEAQLLARSKEPLPGATQERFLALIDRRLTGEPVAYLTGEREFWGRSFAVDRRVLIPRPETEHLIEAALAFELGERPTIVDIGTGSGCIAVTLAAELPAARVLATDFSLDALAVAAANARRHLRDQRLTCLQGDLAEGLDLQRVDLLVSNPPYVNPAEGPSLSHEVHHFEPHLALYADDAGRALITHLLDSARELRSGVHLLLEIGYDQHEWLANAIAERPRLELRRTVRDYGGIPRTAVIRRR